MQLSIPATHNRADNFLSVVALAVKHTIPQDHVHLHHTPNGIVERLELITTASIVFIFILGAETR